MSRDSAQFDEEPKEQRRQQRLEQHKAEQYLGIGPMEIAAAVVVKGETETVQQLDHRMLTVSILIRQCLGGVCIYDVAPWGAYIDARFPQ